MRSRGRIDVDAPEAIDVFAYAQRSITERMFESGSPEFAVGLVFGTDELLTVHELSAFKRERLIRGTLGLP